MINKLKGELKYFKKWYKHGTLRFIALQVARIILFPIMLLLRIFWWVYE